MIVYKWCIKNRNKYFPLVNFGIHYGIRKAYPAYEVKKEYSNFENGNTYYAYRNRNNNFKADIHNSAGFHFFKKPIIAHYWTRFHYFLRNHIKTISKRKKFSILKCRVKKEDIIIEDRELLIAKKFQVIKEVNNANKKT